MSTQREHGRPRESGDHRSPDHQRSDLAAAALAYREQDLAPRVVAKGRGLVAEEILRRAREAGVYVHESRELVSLLMQVDMDRHIPIELYKAVAELLAWLHGLEGVRLAAAPLLPAALPPIQEKLMSDLNMPLPDSPELEKYQIYSRSEIIGLLRDIMDRHVLVTIYFNGGNSFIVTNLLRINPDFEEVVLDCGADPDANRALVRSPRFTVVSFLNHVKIQFSGQRMEDTAFEGTPALRMRLPESMLRFQRREYFRTPVSGKPLVCRIPPLQKKGTPLAVRIVDISCGGAALVGWTGDDERRKAGEVIRDCSIELPDVGRVETAIEIRSITETTTAAGVSHSRCHTHFIGLPGPMVTLIQRYVNVMERSRLSRL